LRGPGIANSGYNPPIRTELFNQERTEQVFLIIVGNADGNIGIAYRLSFKQFQIGAISMQNKTFFQIISKKNTTGLVVFNEFYPDRATL